MSTEDPAYNEACAEVYDQWFGSCEEAAVDLLVELAGAGRGLELGIGSGLLALPLAARGSTCTASISRSQRHVSMYENLPSRPLS